MFSCTYKRSQGVFSTPYYKIQQSGVKVFTVASSAVDADLTSTTSKVTTTTSTLSLPSSSTFMSTIGYYEPPQRPTTKDIFSLPLIFTENTSISHLGSAPAFGKNLSSFADYTINGTASTTTPSLPTTLNFVETLRAHSLASIEALKEAALRSKLGGSSTTTTSTTTAATSTTTVVATTTSDVIKHGKAHRGLEAMDPSELKFRDDNNVHSTASSTSTTTTTTINSTPTPTTTTISTATTPNSVAKLQSTSTTSSSSDGAIGRGDDTVKGKDIVEPRITSITASNRVGVSSPAATSLSTSQSLSSVQPSSFFSPPSTTRAMTKIEDHELVGVGGIHEVNLNEIQRQEAAKDSRSSTKNFRYFLFVSYRFCFDVRFFALFIIVFQ